MRTFNDSIVDVKPRTTRILGMVNLAKSLLGVDFNYILFGKIQSDRLEGEFGVIRQMSGGNYIISVEQVLSSLSLRRLKLYHKLNLDATEITSSEYVCCTGDISDKYACRMVAKFDLG